jgi:hypothetical protein
VDRVESRVEGKVSFPSGRVLCSDPGHDFVEAKAGESKYGMLLTAEETGLPADMHGPTKNTTHYDVLKGEWHYRYDIVSTKTPMGSVPGVLAIYHEDHEDLIPEMLMDTLNLSKGELATSMHVESTSSGSYGFFDFDAFKMKQPTELWDAFMEDHFCPNADTSSDVEDDDEEDDDATAALKQNTLANAGQDAAKAKEQAPPAVEAPKELFACAVPSGFGDGMFNLHVHANESGEMLAAYIVFVTAEIEELANKVFDNLPDGDSDDGGNGSAQ